MASKMIPSQRSYIWHIAWILKGNSGHDEHFNYSSTTTHYSKLSKEAL